MILKRVSKCLLLLAFSSNAFAAVSYIQDNSPVLIQVDPSAGATIELPYPVKMIPVMPKYFEISPQKYSQTDNSNQIKNQADDVTVFSIAPGAKKQDSVIFLLSNGKSIRVNLIPSTSNVSDSFYQLKYIENTNNNFSSNSKFFLSDEKNLMIAMLKDDSKYGRKIVSQNILIQDYPELDFKLLRIYDASKVQGYVIKVENKSDKALQLNPTVLKIGNPNSIVMIQNDHDTMDSCTKNSDPNPTGTGCFSILRLVVRNQSNINSLALGDEQKMPFLIEQKPNK